VTPILPAPTIARPTGVFTPFVGVGGPFTGTFQRAYSVA
jgi:hypothetical protein